MTGRQLITSDAVFETVVGYSRAVRVETDAYVAAPD